MTTIDVIVGNTVDFIVDVDGLSDSPSEVKIELFGKKTFEDGLTDKISEYTPVSITGETVKFVIQTDEIANKPGKVFGRFYVLDQGKKINAYFKMKFTY